MNSLVKWVKSWKLVSWRTAAVVVIVIYGLVGFFVVPVIAKKVIVETAFERTGREVRLAEVRCNPFTLSLTLRGFSFPDRPGSTMLSFDEFHANAQVSSLFRWAATLKEFRLENPYIGVRRFPDGGINVLELLDDIEKRKPPETEQTKEGGLPRALLQYILVTGANIDLEDQAREEPLLGKLGPGRFELRDISTIPDRVGQNDLIIGLEHGGTIKVDGDVVVEPLGLDGSVSIEHVDLAHVWEALSPFFQFEVVDGIAGGRFGYSVFLAEDGPHVKIVDADWLVERIEVKAGKANATVLKIASLTTSDITVAWPEALVRGSAIVVEGAEAFQWIRPDGTPSWDALVPEETQEKAVEIYKDVQEAFPWDIGLDRFEIKATTARVEDRTFTEPLEFVVEDVNLMLTDFRTGPGHQWGLTASVTLPGEGSARVDGHVGTGPIQVEAEVGIENLQIARVQPYVERIAPIELRSGHIETTVTARVSGGGVEPLVSFAGSMTIHDFEVVETVLGSTVLEWERVDTGGINATVRPASLEVATIDIHDAGVEIVVSEDGKINVLEVVAAISEQSEAKQGADEKPQAEAADGEKETATLPLTVETITLHGFSGAFTDRSLTPAFTLALDPVDGTIKGFSTTATAGAVLDIEGEVQSGGMLDVEGEMDLLDPKRLTDLSVALRQADLPPGSPMSVRYIGHPMEEGKVDLGFGYEIVNSDLVGNNKIVTAGLSLGDKVEGEGVVNLPFKLGVSLLTDKEGLITLEFPIEGNLDDPNFSLGNAIGSAAKEIVGGLVTSPFRLLGNLGGGSGDEDLGFVEFEAGSSELEVTAADKLGVVAAGIGQRPEIVLLVEGAWDPAADRMALKEAAFEAAVAERAVSLELLEELYRKSGSAEPLDALRTRNMTTDEDTGGQVLDETAYHRDLQAALIEAQPVDAAGIEALAAARAEAVRAFLVDSQGLDQARVRVIDAVAIEESSEDGWVRCRLDVVSDE